MLIADTGPLVAMLNAKDKHHEACTALFRRFRGPIIVPAPIVTEVAYFLQIEPGPVVEAAFLDALARGELIVEATTTQDFARMAGLVRQYADFPLGTADASVIAVAERLGATHVATIGTSARSAPPTAPPSSSCPRSDAQRQTAAGHARDALAAMWTMKDLAVRQCDTCDITTAAQLALAVFKARQRQAAAPAT
jgi:predicted nucleic acid-binding protein